jgi:hypothetical protein
MLQFIDAIFRNPVENLTVSEFRREFQSRMTNTASHIRRLDKVTESLEDAYDQMSRSNRQGIASRDELPAALANRHLVIAHAAYLQAIKTYLEVGGGSRGSYLVLDEHGQEILEQLGTFWKYKPEEEKFREKILETIMINQGRYRSEFMQRRPIPTQEFWFENVWNAYRQGEIFSIENFYPH